MLEQSEQILVESGYGEAFVKYSALSTAVLHSIETVGIALLMTVFKSSVDEWMNQQKLGNYVKSIVSKVQWVFLAITATSIV